MLGVGLVSAFILQVVAWQPTQIASSVSHTHLHWLPPYTMTDPPPVVISSLWASIPSVATAATTTTVQGVPVPTSELTLPPNMPNYSIYRNNNWTLPSDFIWGVATAAYQVEGAVQAEQRAPSIWDMISHVDGMVASNDNGDVAANHYYTYRQDLQRLKAMGVPYYSFSVSWSRILPYGIGFVNRLALRHYSDVINYALELGIQPIITLYHWDMPLFLQEKYGGWTDPQIVAEFAKLCQVVTDAFSYKVKYFITLNEPQVFCNSYHLYANDPRLIGKFKFNGKAENVKYTCSYYALVAHAAASEYFQKTWVPKYPDRVMSMKHAWSYADPYDPKSSEDIRAARRFMDFGAGWFSDPVYKLDWPQTMKDTLGTMRLPEFNDNDKSMLKGSMMFYAWDGYTGSVVAAPPGGIDACVANTSHPNFPECAVTMDKQKDGWVIGGSAGENSPWLRHTPDLFEMGIHYINEVYNPKGGILIGEFGTSESHESDKSIDEARYDSARVSFYQDYLLRILKLVNVDRVKIIGAIGWSAFDNFEWHEGYGCRFGLQYIDFATQKRYFKKSFFVFCQFFKNFVLAS